MTDDQMRTRTQDRDQAEAGSTGSMLLSEKEAAKLLGFSPRTLQAWRVTGDGPHFIRISPRCIRYRPEDLEAWVNERVHTSTSDYGPEGR